MSKWAAIPQERLDEARAALSHEQEQNAKYLADDIFRLLIEKGHGARTNLMALGFTSVFHTLRFRRPELSAREAIDKVHELIELAYRSLPNVAPKGTKS